MSCAHGKSFGSSCENILSSGAALAKQSFNVIGKCLRSMEYIDHALKLEPIQPLKHLEMKSAGNAHFERK